MPSSSLSVVGTTSEGVPVMLLKVADMRKRNIIEPLAVKEQILKSATETTAMLLRIDNILASSGKTASNANTSGPA
jgi:chaperonin GroEL (HSP60 family)